MRTEIIFPSCFRNSSILDDILRLIENYKTAMSTSLMKNSFGKSRKVDFIDCGVRFYNSEKANLKVVVVDY